MSIKYVNPNHEVSRMFADPSMEIPSKLLAILTWKNGGRLEVTHDDLIEFMACETPFVITHFHQHSIELRCVTLEEGERIASEAGGLPS